MFHKVLYQSKIVKVKTKIVVFFFCLSTSTATILIHAFTSNDLPEQFKQPTNFLALTYSHFPPLVHPPHCPHSDLSNKKSAYLVSA